jgi:hypothetical protein
MAQDYRTDNGRPTRRSFSGALRLGGIRVLGLVLGWIWVGYLAATAWVAGVLVFLLPRSGDADETGQP